MTAAHLAPPLRTELPDPPAREGTDGEVIDKIVEYLPTLNGAILHGLLNKMPRSSPVSELLLASPNGSVYAVVVSNTGVLSTVLRYQQT
jgi:hypothetical protein